MSIWTSKPGDDAWMVMVVFGLIFIGLVVFVLPGSKKVDRPCEVTSDD